VMVISGLLLRLAARFPLKTAVAQVFTSASESGSRGIEELQNQTVSLLSFQKISHKVFGAQLAFNLLSRLGCSATGEVARLETRLRRQLGAYLGERVPRPALRLFQVPVFYSMGVSLYVETDQPVSPEAVAAAVSCERVKVRRSTLDAPTQIEVTGSSDILVDSISRDAEHPNGLWLWAVADNLHLAAANAVELAASLREHARA
jgi:aspartate-semialdehyde dehydrogenase